MMNFVVMIGVGIGAYVLGVFGFAQIYWKPAKCIKKRHSFYVIYDSSLDCDTYWWMVPHAYICTFS